MGCIIQPRGGEAEQDEAEDDLEKIHEHPCSTKKDKDQETTNQSAVMYNPQNREIRLHCFSSRKGRRKWEDRFKAQVAFNATTVFRVLKECESLSLQARGVKERRESYEVR